MHYEENVINGVICWRGTPNGKWIQKTPEQLTERIMLMTKQKQSDGVYEPAPYWLNPQFKMPPSSA